MKLMRSVGSILGSYILCVVLVILSEIPLKAAFPHECADIGTAPTRILALSTAIFFLVSILCAWICANRPRSARQARPVVLRAG